MDPATLPLQRVDWAEARRQQSIERMHRRRRESYISGEWKPATANMFVYVDNADARYKKAIDAGSETVMEPADQDYGRSCGVTDPFGNVWWITSVIGQAA